jgi:hypothetical protein
VTEGRPSIQAHLPPNVVVKWEDWREWTEVHTDRSYLEWTLRFTVVPDDFSNPSPGFEPKSSFLTIEREDGEGADLTPLTFTFHTYGLAVTADRAEALRASVADGTIYPMFRGGQSLLAHPEQPIALESKPFLDLIAYMRRYVNKNYEDILLSEQAGA